MSTFKSLNQALSVINPISRFFSQQAAIRAAATPAVSIRAANVDCPYFVPRNTRGSLPVYSDIRNGGTRYLVILEDIEGDINVLRNDLQSTLFKPESVEANKVKVAVARNNKLIITGGRWKYRVLDWLSAKGF